MKLELGPGANGATREGYSTLDIDKNYHPNFIGDAKDLSQFGDNSIETILAIHILEHLGHWYEITDILRGWYRVLVPGGYAEIYMPDWDYILDCYLTGKWRNEVANPDFNFPHGSDVDKDKWINFKLFSTAIPFDNHFCCLSFSLLKEYAFEAGFKMVEKIPGNTISLAVKVYK